VKRTQKPKGETEITAQGGSRFDNNAREAVFIEDVIVVDPEFTLYCDRLTAYLKKVTAESGEGQAGNVHDATGGLDHAIAESKPGKQVVIVQDKAEASGAVTRSVARGNRATYDANTGDLVLYGNPSVQRGINLTYAIDPSTVITLNRDGEMIIKGPTRTLIKEFVSTKELKQ